MRSASSIRIYRIYPDTYKLAFLHRSDKAEIEVWIELNLTYEYL